MPTLKDVAREAGVSPGTVSKVLNNARYVQEGTRQRVLAAIQALDYQPSLYASALRNKRSQTIGIMTERPLTYEYVASALTGVLENLAVEGLAALVSETDGTADSIQRVVGHFQRRHVDGVIYIGSGRPAPVLNSGSEWMASRVYLFTEPEVPDGSVVLADDTQGASVGVQHLLDLGHRRIAFVGGPQHSLTARNRWLGFRAALEANDIELLPDLVRHGHWSEDFGFASVIELSATRKEFTAVATANDFIAAGAVHALQALGKRIPDDVAVLGFDDNAVASIVRPRLTTLVLPGRVMGHAAVRLLSEALAQPADGVSTWSRLAMPCQLVVRESTISHLSRPQR